MENQKERVWVFATSGPWTVLNAPPEDVSAAKAEVLDRLVPAQKRGWTLEWEPSPSYPAWDWVLVAKNSRGRRQWTAGLGRKARQRS